MKKVTNIYNVEIDFDVAIELMDDELREELHAKLTPCAEQDFFNAYAQAHEERYNEIWELNKENPIY